MEHHISKIHWGNKDPQKNNLWYLEIYPITTSTQGYEDWGKSAIDQQTIDFLSTDDDSVSYYVRSAKIPNLSIGNHESKFMGLKIQLPSPEDTSEKRLDLTFDEFESQKIYTAFNDWISSIFNVNGEDEIHNENTVLDSHTANLHLTLLGLNGEPLDKKIVFYKAFPTSISSAELSYESSSKINYTVSFLYQYYRIVENPYIPDANVASLELE